jgi:hypothetical protein
LEFKYDDIEQLMGETGDITTSYFETYYMQLESRSIKIYVDYITGLPDGGLASGESCPKDITLSFSGSAPEGTSQDIVDQLAAALSDTGRYLSFGV